MQLRWYFWPTPIKLALCSIGMALILYHLAGAPTRSKGKSIGSFEPKTSNKRLPSTDDIAPTFTVPAEARPEVDYWPITAESARKCYNLTLILESKYLIPSGSATCGSVAASDSGRELCKTTCNNYTLQYKRSYFPWLAKKNLFRAASCVQSDKSAADISYDVSAAENGLGLCSLTCTCQIANKIRVRLPTLGALDKSIAVSPSMSKKFWGFSQFQTRTCHPEDMLRPSAALSQVPGFTPSDSPSWQTTYQVTAENIPCDIVNWEKKCLCKKLNGKELEHGFRPSICKYEPVPEGQPTQNAKISKKARVDSATEKSHLDGAVSSSADSTTAHASNLAGLTPLPSALGLQDSISSIFGDLGDIHGFSGFYNELSVIQPNEYGMPQKLQSNICHNYPPWEFGQCPADHNPYASQSNQNTVQHSEDLDVSFEQQRQCGSSTSCNPAHFAPFKKRQETKRDEGDAGSRRCARASGAGHEQRPAPFI
ncbi:hypothetical protein BCR37DRAFT_386292 [Protomyces lactucae-debilis]|uniref:Uncharacterized protein n=1 Tax=Protomyces lactucae-debilis TaxID=2754530 RepID=A0A1Y2FP23_PROLT|nr:uncharacterized protein BCR37DRAFT_386292 [Protomyces lactucae-debilis]ORY84956.1 hypothetical protein BCR37DRAFT_386292 [Protomyces lactucae-debilis]